MARTCKRIATTRSFATKSSQPAIRFLQDHSMPILEPVIQAENVDQNEHRSATMKVSLPPFSSSSSHGGGSHLSAKSSTARNERPSDESSESSSTTEGKTQTRGRG